MLLFKETNELDRIYVFFPEGDLALPQIKVCVGRFVKSAPIAPWGRRCAGCGTNPPRIPCAATLTSCSPPHTHPLAGCWPG
jgi:hypothetical protein